MKSVRKAVLITGAAGGTLWGASLFMAAIASAPVTAPIAAAAGAIVASSVMLGAASTTD